VSPIPRTWLAFAAVGAGLIHLALALGAPGALAAVLAIVGVVEFAYGLATMGAGRLLAPRATLVGALSPIALWILAILALDNEPALRVVPLAIASLLELFGATAIAVFLRRGRNGGTRPAASALGTGRYLRGVLAGGLVIAALTLGALAATNAASFVAPKGSFTDEHDPH
jgi:hypothetical protein